MDILLPTDLISLSPPPQTLKWVSSLWGELVLRNYCFVIQQIWNIDILRTFYIHALMQGGRCTSLKVLSLCKMQNTRLFNK